MTQDRLTQVRDWQQRIRSVNVKNGWFDREVTFAMAMMNLHSEVSEAWEAWRQWGTADMTGMDPPERQRGGEVPLPKPEGVGSEFADIMIRLLDDCERWGIDIEREVERKMAYNMVRPYRHGGKRA